MASNTSLINVDAADTATTLNEFIGLFSGDSAAYVAECKSLVDGLKTEQLIDKYLIHADDLISLDNEKEVEACFQAIISILFTLRDGVDSVPVVSKILTAVSSKTDKPRLRLKVLISVFNLVSLAASKAQAITTIFDFAVATGQASHVAEFHSNVDKWIVSWQLSPAETRGIYSKVFDVLLSDNKISTSLTYLTKYFDTFPAGAGLPEEAALRAQDIILKTLRTPIQFFSDRLSLLKSFHGRQVSATLQAYIELLRIICHGSSKDLSTFYASSNNKSFIDSSGFSITDMLHTQQLLSICDFAASKSSASYADVAAHLNISEDEVEMWIVEAISSGIVEANMNQMAGTVTFSKYIHRNLAVDQWKSLRTQLMAIRENIVSARDAVKSVKQKQSQGGPTW